MANCIALALFAAGLVGCSRGAQESRNRPEPPAMTQLSDADIARIKPNEMGKVLILEYHEISDKEARWSRDYRNFRADLARLYAAGYRPVSLRDFVQGNINIPAGKSPVVFTFDDSTPGQFSYINEGQSEKVDPNCAVSILEDFHKQHPDWDMAATFYIYYHNPFRQPKHIERKLRYIHSLGMDIGNHTFSHVNLRKLSSAEATKEMALSVKEAQRWVPGIVVDSIALPYGLGPKDEALLRSGEYQGQSYRNIAALLVGAEPAPSPVSRDFKPYRLPRVQAIQSELDNWLGYLARHPEKRYVSDGDPKTVTVPKNLESGVDKARLAGKKLRAY